MELTNSDESTSNKTWLRFADHPGYVLALMFFFSAIILWSNYDKPFYNFDDEIHFRAATENSLSSLFFNLNADITYMPVAYLSNRLDSILFGPPPSEVIPTKRFIIESNADAPDGLNTPDPAASNFLKGKNWAPPVRIESGIFHALAGFVLWAFLRRLKVGAGIALFVASAWTVHPMACESVCWISERKNVLAALFGFTALWAQTHRENSWRWPLVTVLYLLATLSKPTAVGVFPIIVAVEFLEPGAPIFEWRNGGNWLRVFAGLAGPLAVTVFIVWVNVNIHKIFFVAPPGGSLYSALLTDLEIFSRYIFNIFVPVNLSFFYGLDPICSISDARTWIFGAVLIGFCIAAIGSAQQEMRFLALLGLLWFFGALGPNANIAAIPYWMQDRYAYISTAGLLLTVALGVQGLSARLPERFATALPALGFSFVLFLTVLTFNRSPLFQDASTLVDDATVRQPKSGMAHYISAHNHSYLACVNRDPDYVRDGGIARDALRAIDEYDLAVNCADIDNFCNSYRLRVKRAQLLNFVGDFTATRAYLKDWLPPKNYTMHDFSQSYTASKMATTYVPQTLAYGWLVEAVARWQLATLLDRKTVPVAIRISETNAAIAEVDNSIKVTVWDYQAFVLKARMLLFLSILDEENKDMPSSDRHVNEAIRNLQQVPATSPLGAEATKLLARVVRP